MLRTELIDKLDLVAPAISTVDLIPILSHVWCLGDHILSYNDQIAIQVPCDLGIECALPGTTIISLLKSSRAKDVTFSMSDNEVIVKAASSTFKLAMLPSNNFIFEMPKPEGSPLPVKFDEFLAGIQCCMRSVSADTSIPDQLGITLLDKGSELHLYATNNATISHSKVKLSGKCPFKERVVLSAPFCKEMLELAKGTKPQLYIHDDHSLLVLGKISLFGRLIEVDKPIDFISVLSHHLPDDHRKQLIEIPTKLELILERAIVITDSATEQTRTAINVQDGVMRFYSKSGKGEVKDSMQVGSHPEVSVKIEPKLLKNGYGNFDHFLITDACAIMAKGQNLYLIAATSG